MSDQDWRQYLEAAFARVRQQGYDEGYADGVRGATCKESLPVQSRYPWHEAPEWAEWAATDSDGCWSWYEAKPKVGLYGDWINKPYTKWDSVEYKERQEQDWRTTLERRPK